VELLLARGAPAEATPRWRKSKRRLCRRKITLGLLQAFGQCPIWSLYKICCAELEKQFRPPLETGNAHYSAGLEWLSSAPTLRDDAETFAAWATYRYVKAGHVMRTDCGHGMMGRLDPRRGPRTRHKLLVRADPYAQYLFPAAGAHTVIVKMGQVLTIRSQGRPDCHEIGLVEPAPRSWHQPGHQFAQASFRYNQTGSRPQRTLALIRISRARAFISMCSFARRM